MQKIIRPLFSLFENSVQQINDGKKTVTHYISGGEPNDYGQVLNPNGYDDSRYRKNPIVLFQHGLNDLFVTTPARVQLDFILGKNSFISVEGNYLKAETEFRSDDKSDFASDVFNLYKLGFLKGWSKWFYPISEPRAENGLMYYDKWGIYEYSSVFIPVDEDATTRETSLLNAFESVRSEPMKKYFMHSLVSQKTGDDDDAVKFINEIKNIKDEINKLKDNDSKNELGKIADESIEKYHKIIMPRLEHFAGSIKQLNDFRCNLEALVENAVKNSLKTALGKID
jgi:hypothetical protein